MNIDTLGEHVVDMTAIGALLGLAFSPVSDGVVPILVGGVVTVAIGKRYYAKKQ